MIGIDILKVSRFKKVFNPSFRRRVFSAREQAYCERKKGKMLHYAARFAAKEAVIKALLKRDLNLKEIEILNRRDGSPYVCLNGVSRRVEISLSHEYDFVVAVAVAGAR